jgi:hypothetical protein
MASRLPCFDCAQLAEHLASATFEVAVIQKEILAQGLLKKASVNDAIKLEAARRLAREALNALTEHNLSHKGAPDDLKRSG